MDCARAIGAGTVYTIPNQRRRNEFHSESPTYGMTLTDTAWRKSSGRNGPNGLWIASREGHVTMQSKSSELVKEPSGLRMRVRTRATGRVNSTGAGVSAETLHRCMGQVFGAFLGLRRLPKQLCCTRPGNECEGRFRP